MRLVEKYSSGIIQAMDEKVPWPHAPPHFTGHKGIYFVTAGIYQKEHHFRGKARLDVLHRGLLKVCFDNGWALQAWAVFPNHYHFVAASPDNEESAASLSPMLARLHELTAKWVNRLDQTPGRKVWHNFRETHLTFEKSWLARLHYVHANAVHHGLVASPTAYPWCSAAWFESSASQAFVKTIYGVKTDKIRVEDDFPTQRIEE
jgi:putative transposase